MFGVARNEQGADPKCDGDPCGGNQAMDCGFRIIASAGLRGDRVLTSMEPELAFHDSSELWQE
jgi:hypothetical protein